MEAPFHAQIADAPAPAQVIWLRAGDGRQLRAAFWTAGPRGIVALFPGRTEMIEKYGRVVRDLVAAGFGAAVIDWRGQGLSDRLCDQPLLGHVKDFAEFQQDVAAYRAALDSFAPGAPLYVLAHSMGGCIALRALREGFPARAAAFSAPMWGLPLGRGLSLAVRSWTGALQLAGRAVREVPGAGIEFRLWENPFDNNELTSDRDSYDWMQAQVAQVPELRLGAPSMPWLIAALAETAALAKLDSPALPALCGLGTRELLVSPKAIEDRMERWPQGRLAIYEGALHELLMETPATRDDFLAQTIALFSEH